MYATLNCQHKTITDNCK